MRRRDQVLTMLRAAPGVVTYDWIRRVTGLSRMNMHFQITQLRIDGHRIENMRRFGYWLA